MRNVRKEPGATAVRPLSKTLLLALGLAALTFAIFAPAIGYDYIDLDDPQYVFGNPRVLSGLNADNIRWAFSHVHESWWLPMLWISYMADASLFGTEPWGFHLVNILLHAANALLLFLALRIGTGRLRPALFAAALFAIHPLRVESVAWITERKDVLSGLFWMLALLVHLRRAEKPAVRSGIPLFLLMVLGLLSKATVVTLPAVLLLLDFWPLGRLGTREGLKACLREKAPLFALAAAFAALTLTTHTVTGGQHSALDGWARISLMPGNVLPYLAKFLWPVRLSIYYVEHDVVRWTIFGAASAGLLAFTALCWRVRRRAPYLLMGWLWFLIALFPVIRGLRLGIAEYANRFIYLPSIGLSIAASFGGAALFRNRAKGARTAGLLAILILGACGALTAYNLRFWRDSDTLFRRAWELDPGNYLGITGRGIALQKQERREEALAHFQRAVADYPQTVRYRVHLALALINLDRLPEAFAALEEARRGAPDEPEFEYALGLAHLHAGRPGQARLHLARAAEGMGKMEAMCRSELACACFEDGDPAAASEQLRLARGLDSPATFVYGDLLPFYAWTWDSGERPRALRYFRKLAAERAEDPGILNNIAWLLAVSEHSPAPPGEALALARQAVAWGGEAQPVLLDTLAAAHANAGQYEEAVAWAEKARLLAVQQNQRNLARRLEQRLEHYRHGKPWREKTGS